jgi:hypothetical protein
VGKRGFHAGMKEQAITTYNQVVADCGRNSDRAFFSRHWDKIKCILGWNQQRRSWKAEEKRERGKGMRTNTCFPRRKSERFPIRVSGSGSALRPPISVSLALFPSSLLRVQPLPQIRRLLCSLWPWFELQLRPLAISSSIAAIHL